MRAVTTYRLWEMKQRREKIAMLTSYDYSMARIVDAAGVDVILVGAVMAIVCARIYYIVFAPFKYESIWQMIDIRQGGIAILSLIHI